MASTAGKAVEAVQLPSESVAATGRMTALHVFSLGLGGWVAVHPDAR